MKKQKDKTKSRNNIKQKKTDNEKKTIEMYKSNNDQ